MVITPFEDPNYTRTFSLKGDAEDGEVFCSQISSEEIRILGLTEKTYGLLGLAGMNFEDETPGTSDTPDDLLYWVTN